MCTAIPTSLSPEELSGFRDIRDHFLENTPLPVSDKWRSMSNDKIWRRVVGQVVVVGNAAPAERLNDVDIQVRLEFASLAKPPTPATANAIGRVLADIGTRYVSRERPETSPKTTALVKNLAFLQTFCDGPRGFVTHLSTMNGSRERIDYLSRNFSFFGPKGARDFLTTGLGMATDLIALDSRVMGIARLIVPTLPAKVNRGNYDDIERFLVEHVCEPLCISAMEFDQLLFCNKDAIHDHLTGPVVIRGGRRTASVGSSSCRAGRQPVAASTDLRRRGR